MLPFLAAVTRWLGNGADVLFEEFGAPTRDPNDPEAAAVADMLLDEPAAADYTARALEALAGAGCTGALLWCYADYAPAIWAQLPLDAAVHERHFGLWRADGSAKPAAAELSPWRGRERSRASDDTWIELRREDFYRKPLSNLVALYAAYRNRP